MNQQAKDETRWLVRFLGVLVILLGIHNIYMQFHRLQTDSGSKSFAVFAFAGFLCWFGYRLFRCSSLWNIVFWFSESSVTSLYIQSQYNRINPHIRFGIVTGIIAVIAQFFLPALQLYYKGTGFYEWFKYIWIPIYWPLKQMYKLVDPNNSSVPVFAVFANLFIAGFIIGAGVSCLKKCLGKDSNPRNSI